VPNSSVLAELRRATASIHADLETGSDIEARLHDPERRGEMVGAFYAFHEAAERGLAPFGPDLSAVGWRATPRAGSIERDATGLGFDVRKLPPPVVADLGEAFGWTYVVEGSTLGGRVIRRRLTAAGVSLAGLNFLDPWGEATGARWRNMVQVLEDASACGLIGRSAILNGASAAFEFAGRVLVQPRHAEMA
jgi:heme oxygenase